MAHHWDLIGSWVSFRPGGVVRVVPSMKGEHPLVGRVVVSGVVRLVAKPMVRAEAGPLHQRVSVSKVGG